MQVVVNALKYEKPQAKLYHNITVTVIPEDIYCTYQYISPLLSTMTTLIKNIDIFMHNIYMFYSSVFYTLHPSATGVNPKIRHTLGV